MKKGPVNRVSGVATPQDERIAEAIRAVQAVYPDPRWRAWADAWMRRVDRSSDAAHAAAKALTAERLIGEEVAADREAHVAQSAAAAACLVAMASSHAQMASVWRAAAPHELTKSISD